MLEIEGKKHIRIDCTNIKWGSMCMGKGHNSVKPTDNYLICILTLSPK